MIKETSRIEILTSLGGWEGLRNFETAAYSQFIHSAVFKEELLPRHAHALADRLGNTVKTLIVPIIDNNLDDVHSRLRFRFIELFTACLNLKAALAITDNQFQFMIHPLGISQDDNVPMASFENTFNRTEKLPTDERTESYLHASIKVYQEGCANLLEPQAGGIVQTNNFVIQAPDPSLYSCVYTKAIMVQTFEEAPEHPNRHTGDMIHHSRSSEDQAVTSINPMLQVRRTCDDSISLDRGSSTSQCRRRCTSSIERTHDDTEQLATHPSCSSPAWPAENGFNDDDSLSDVMLVERPTSSSRIDQVLGSLRSETQLTSKVEEASKKVLPSREYFYHLEVIPVLKQNTAMNARNDKNPTRPKCEECGQLFKNSVNLARHIKNSESTIIVLCRKY